MSMIRQLSSVVPRSLRTTAMFFLVLGPSVLYAFAQGTTATLSGSVIDQNNAVVPGVEIIITNPSTALERTATTSEAGYFTVPLLPPGTYIVTAKHQGFTPVRISNLVLNVADQKSLQIQLKTGDVNATVQ